MTLRRFLAVCATCVLLAAAAQAQVGFTQSPVTERYTPGAPFELALTIDVTSSEQLNAIGVAVSLPAGWSFDGYVSGAPEPQVSPSIGETGVLEFAWFPLPDTFPVSFTIRIDVPEGTTATQSISSEAYVLLDETGEITVTQDTVVPNVNDGEFHTADQDLSGAISLSELLRLIQFYNSGGFHCADFPDDTEDGYQPGILGNKACAFHDSDYNTQDWNITLTELLRAIQFYNSLGLYSCPENETEDGFCPGPAA